MDMVRTLSVGMWRLYTPARFTCKLFLCSVSTMNPAELKTHHQALGVSTEFLAERIGCHVNLIWRWEHPSRTIPIAPHAEAAVRQLLNDREAALERLTVELRDWGSLPRYADLADFDAAVPEMAGWGDAAQGLMLAELQARLQAPIEYVSMGGAA